MKDPRTNIEPSAFARTISAQIGVLAGSDPLMTASTREELRDLQLVMALFADCLDAEALARVPMRRVRWWRLRRWWVA